MICQDLQARLSAFVDGELTPDERREVLMHLDGCAACRLIARDLERLRAAARELGPIEPPVHVWLEVAGQIHLGARRQPVPLVATASRRPPLRQYLSLAAALALLAGGVYVVDRATDEGAAPGTEQTTPGAQPPAAAAMQSVTDELAAALTHYDNAMSQLQQLANTGETALDPQVASALQENLTIIDRAIAESRGALETDPQSEAARSSLIDALRQKVLVLQTTVELTNEMRKGNQDGAARVVPASGRKS